MNLGAPFQHLDDTSNFGLVVFVLAWILTGAVLMVDWWLSAHGVKTFTRRCAEDPMLAWFLFASVCVGPMGLLLHLLTFGRK